MKRLRSGIDGSKQGVEVSKREGLGTKVIVAADDDIDVLTAGA